MVILSPIYRGNDIIRVGGGDRWLHVFLTVPFKSVNIC